MVHTHKKRQELDQVLGEQLGVRKKLNEPLTKRTGNFCGEKTNLDTENTSVKCGNCFRKQNSLQLVDFFSNKHEFRLDNNTSHNKPVKVNLRGCFPQLLVSHHCILSWHDEVLCQGEVSA